jgi:hypothetical protein
MYKLSWEVANDIKNVRSFEEAKKFTSLYGTDFLFCDFIRTQIRYKLVRIKTQPHTLDDLEQIALGTLGTRGTSFRPNFPDSGEISVTMVKSGRIFGLEFHSETYFPIQYEIVDNGTQVWVPLFELIKRYWLEFNTKSMPLTNQDTIHPWMYLESVWFWRKLKKFCGDIFLESFFKRYKGKSLPKKFKL